MVTKYEYTQIPADTFEKLGTNAGMLVDEFDPETRVIGKQIGATTGGIKVDCTPSFVDKGDDIDNCPKNVQYISGDAGMSQNVPVNHEYAAVTSQEIPLRFISCEKIVRQMCAKKRRGKKWPVSKRLKEKVARRIRLPCQWAGTPRIGKSGTIRLGSPSGP